LKGKKKKKKKQVLDCLCSFLWISSPLYDQLQVTPEQMEAYRMKRFQRDDPMNNFPQH